MPGPYTRGLDEEFLFTMREKLAHGRRQGYVGWDRRWKNCTFPSGIRCGPFSFLMERLRHEVVELTCALISGDKKSIRSEAADVANLAMMVADIEGALE